MFLFLTHNSAPFRKKRPASSAYYWGSTFLFFVLCWEPERDERPLGQIAIIPATYVY
jgi:hypothetical protein